MTISSKELRRLVSGAYGRKPTLRMACQDGPADPVEWPAYMDLMCQNAQPHLVHVGVGALSGRQSYAVYEALGANA